MTTIVTPNGIPLSVVQQFVRDLGLDPDGLVQLNVGMDGVHVQCHARDADGKRYSTPSGNVAVHTLSLKLDISA